MSLQYVSWQAMGTPGPPYVQYAGKNVRLVMAELLKMFPGSENWGIWNYRLVRGGSMWSTHAFDAAGDWAYESDRAARDAATAWLILHHEKLHIQMIVDEGRGMTWKSSRDEFGGGPGWKTGVVAGPWLHFETTPAGYADDTPIAQRLAVAPSIPTYPPPITEEEDMRLIQPYDDVCVLVQDGIVCTWASSGEVVAALAKAGLVAPEVHIIDRIGLKGLELHGPAPTEAAYVGASRPGRTKPTDFAVHRP